MKKIFILISLLLFSVSIHAADDSLERYNKATSYLLGKNGQIKSPQIAAKLFLELAEDGYPMAQYMLGKLYLKGQGVPKDIDTAVTWFYLSANQHFLPAIKKLSEFKEKASFQELDLEKIAVVN